MSLRETLAALEEHQLLAVCLLGGYRANGPYDETCRHWMRLGRHFAPFVPALHVITASDGSGPRASFFQRWRDGEQRLLATDLPVEVLFDPRNEVAEAVYADSSPHVFLVDRDLTVWHRGRLEGPSLWEALSRQEADRSRRSGPNLGS